MSASANVKVITSGLKELLQEKDIDPRKIIEKANELSRETGLVTKRKYVPPSINDLKQRFATNQELRRRAIRGKLPFIDINNGPEFKLTQGLILIGGVSGQGKSTTSGNILANFLETDTEKRALVITNEENMGAVYTRTACVLLKLNFKDYYNGRLPEKLERKVEEQAEQIMERVTVEDGNEAYDMTCMEDVQAALVHAAEGGYGIALMDYFQTVTQSAEEPDLDPVRVSKKLGFFMKDYGRKVEIPVVMFVQLKDSNEMHFKDRVENDRTIYNHAFMVIEVIPDFQNRTSKFVFHKDRFGDAQGKEIVMTYINGRFEAMGEL